MEVQWQPLHGLLDRLDLATLSIWCYLIPVTVGLIYYPRLSRVQHTVLLLPLVSFCMEVVNGSKTLGLLWGREVPTNIPFFHFFAPVTFFMTTLLYARYLGRRRLLVANAVFILIALLDATLISGLYQINRVALPAMALGCVWLVVLYLLDLMSTLEVQRVDRDPLFWASVGILFYNAGSFLLFFSLQYLLMLKSYEAIMTVYGLHSALTLFLNVLFVVALAMPPTRPAWTPPV